ncbi:MAG: SprT family zinc-dependent metalloprotease [Coriobacteriia bacterium]|nr:SprT family zinc-dependent metalloprotease [Coriobacteriia bacterium]
MTPRELVTYGGRSIAYEVFRADRTTLSITVNPDGVVEVVAPLGIALEDIRARIHRRARWIANQQRYFEQFLPRTPPRRFVSGETHLYLGRQYRLRVVVADEESVKLNGGRFVVHVVGGPVPERVEVLLGQWYAAKASERLTERLEECWKRFSGGCASDVPPLRIRRMRSRWGSMSSSGLLTLNVDLIRAPRECLDYVILHELCHLEHADHGAAFRARLEQVLPDWERRKHRLELTLA